MEKIYHHIEKLLAYHDYVVVPELGGFVVQSQPAYVYFDRITPPSVSVAFNPLMRHADGLLAIEVARAEGVTYRHAMEIIDQDVDKINQQLNNKGQIQFGSLGLLCKDENSNLIFTPDKLVSFLPNNIGLADLHVSERALNDVSKSKTISFVIPTAKTFKYAAAAVLLFGMLFISPQVNDVKRSSSASIISLNSFCLDTLKPLVEKADEVVVAPCPEIVETKLPNGIVQNNDSDLYHVVVASLPTQKSADEYCEMLKESDFECAHVLEPIKSYRVSIKSFADRAEAITYMETLRKTDSRFETAWVLCK